MKFFQVIFCFKLMEFYKLQSLNKIEDRNLCVESKINCCRSRDAYVVRHMVACKAYQLT